MSTIFLFFYAIELPNNKNAQELAAKKVIAVQLKAEMEKQNLTKSAIEKNEYNTQCS